MRGVLFAFMLSSGALFGMSHGGVEVQLSGGEDGYYYDDGYYSYPSQPVWYGPGWYYGRWYDNPNDYYRWHRNHRHYPHHWNDHDHGSKRHHRGNHHH